MANLELICQEIAKAIEDNIDDINALAFHEQINTPAALIEPQTVDFSAAMSRGHERWDITIRVLSSGASEGAGHQSRFEFFGGAKDIKDAVESHVPLRDGTVAHDVFVREAANFGTWEISGIAYIGGEIMVDVYA